MLRVSLLALGVTAAGSAIAQGSLSTIFASDSIGAPDGAVYFDFTFSSNNIITGFDVNTNAAAGTPIDLLFYSFGGTYVGNEVGGPWQLLQAGSGLSAGLDQPTHIDLDFYAYPVSSPAAFALVLNNELGTNPQSHAYSIGNGSNQFYSDTWSTISLGSASDLPFTGPILTPRVWNGAVHYTFLPEPGTYVAIGLGLSLLWFRRRK
jgi:hypothetical protein